MKRTINEQSKLITALNCPDRFKPLKDGWIQDSYTGLDFGPSSEKIMDMEKALEYCESKGGRLPELHELHSLVDFTKEKPAIQSIFKDTKHTDWYWSGTKTAWSNSASWCVSFYYGCVSFSYEGGGCFVRPVRASQ